MRFIYIYIYIYIYMVLYAMLVAVGAYADVESLPSFNRFEFDESLDDELMQ